MLLTCTLYMLSMLQMCIVRAGVTVTFTPPEPQEYSIAIEGFNGWLVIVVTCMAWDG